MTFIKKVINPGDIGDADHVGGVQWDLLDDFFDDVATGLVGKINSDLWLRSGRLKLAKTSGTEVLTFNLSALTTSRAVNYPNLGADDEPLFKTFAATILNKNIESDNNTIKDSTTNAAGDLLKGNGTKYVRFARGSALQVLRVNSGGTDLEWAAPAGGGGDSITVNGVAVVDADFDDATPAAPTDTVNVKFQKDASSPANISAYLDVNTVTKKILADIATDRLLGRDTAGTGDPEELTVTGGLEFTGSGGIQRSALTGDVTASAGSNATAIATNAVVTAKILDANVTLAKIANIATDRILGRDTAASGVIEELTLNTTLEFTGAGGIQRAALTGDVTATAGSNTTAIGAGVIVDGDINASGITTRSKLPTPIAYEDEANTFTLGAQTFQVKADFNKGFYRTGVISPAQITSDQNNYAPTNWNTSSIIRLNADSSFRTITGLGDATQTDGMTIALRNISANNILLANQNTDSTAANRFDFGGYDMPLFPGGQITLFYDGTSSRWMIDSPQLPILPPTRYGIYYRRFYVNTGSDQYVNLLAASGGTAAPPSPAVAGQPGYAELTLGTSATGNGGSGQAFSNFILLGNSWYWRYEARVKLVALSDGTNTYKLRVGFIDSESAEPNDGVYFRYTHSVNSGKWELVARSNGTETVTNATNTAVAAATWYRLTVIVNPAGNKAEFFQDGVSLGTVATNIPTGAGRGTGFGVFFVKSAGTANNIVLDINNQEVLAYSNVAV